MNVLITNALSGALSGSKRILDAPTDWPNPASGLAYRLFSKAGVTRPYFAGAPLNTTDAGQLRRTPELAAFGYVGDILDDATAALWREGFEHLRGRQIYPPDRQSFVFNPIEILGVATGLTLCADLPPLSKEWFAGVIRKGLADNQFRSPLPKAAAFAALGLIGALNGTEGPAPPLVLPTMATPELLLTASLRLAFEMSSPDINAVEQAFIARLLTEDFIIGDVAEAAAVFVLSQRIIDRVALGGQSASSTDRVIALCRRFPLFVQQLQKRQQKRSPFIVNDEYDVQDLLHAVLRLHFEDVRPEEHTPSYAGNSSRVDFFLPDSRILVEAKMTRKTLGQKEVANELIIDAARYAQMDGVDTLICLIYDPTQRCGNPKSLEADVEKAPTRLKVHAIVCPHGL